MLLVVVSYNGMLDATTGCALLVGHKGHLPGRVEA
jgi:hypothetical protein